MSKKDTSVLDIQAELRKSVATLRETVAPPSGFVISTKGKQFTLPDGRQSAGPLECIILDHVSANLYYTGAYNPSKPSAPSCFAIGRSVKELAPSDNSPQKQDPLCEDCAFNQWGSAPSGNGKACKNTRRLLIVPADAGDDAQQYILNVSPSGIKHYDKYIDALASNGKHPIQVITNISFDSNEAYPSLRFAIKEPHDRLEAMWNLRTSGESLLFQEPTSNAA